MGDSSLAEDAAQAVFMALAQSAGKMRRGRPVSGWLFKATRYVCANLRRRAAARERHEAEAGRQWPEASGGPGDGPGEESPWEEVVPLLDGAIESLGAKEREVVLLKYFRGLETEALAAELRLEEPAVRKRLSRAVGHLREHFARQGVVMTEGGVARVLGSEMAGAAPKGLARGILAAVAMGHSGVGSGAVSAALVKGVVVKMGVQISKLAIAGVAATSVVVGVVVVSVAGGLGEAGPNTAPTPARVMATAPPTSRPVPTRVQVDRLVDEATQLANAGDYAGAMEKYAAYIAKLSPEMYRDKKDFEWILRQYEAREGAGGQVDYTAMTKAITDALRNPAYDRKIWQWRLQRLQGDMFGKWGNRRAMREHYDKAIEEYPREAYADASKLSSLQHLYNARAMIRMEEEGNEAVERYIVESLRNDARFQYFFAQPWIEAYQRQGHPERFAALVEQVVAAYEEKGRKNPADKALMDTNIRLLRQEAGR